MSTAFVPLKALQAWYDGDTPASVAVSVFLLDATVTTLVDGYATVAELPGLLATTGSYNATTGIAAGDWPLNYDDTEHVMELSLPAADWTSAATYDLTFRWVVLAGPEGNLLSAVDFVDARTLVTAPLMFWATESTYIPTSYPVLRWRKA